jgi:hypothetical protein
MTASPHPTSAATAYQKLIGTWYSDTTMAVQKDNRITVRICGTEEFFENGTSRLRAEVITMISETDENFGIKAAVLVDATNSEKVEGGIRSSTTMAGQSNLNSFITIIGGQKYNWDELPEQYKKQISDMKSGFESSSFGITKGETSEGTIKWIDEGTFVEETPMDDGSSFVATSKRTNRIIDRCPD